MILSLHEVRLGLFSQVLQVMHVLQPLQDLQWDLFLEDFSF